MQTKMVNVKQFGHSNCMLPLFTIVYAHCPYCVTKVPMVKNQVTQCTNCSKPVYNINGFVQC